MLTADTSAAFAYPVYNDFRNIQIIEADCCRNDIHDGIDGADLVKMHFFYGFIMRFCLCACKYFKNLHCKSPCPFRHLEAVDNCFDVGQVAAVVMVVVMVVSVVVAMLMFVILIMIVTVCMFKIMVVIMVFVAVIRILGMVMLVGMFITV